MFLCTQALLVPDPDPDPDPVALHEAYGCEPQDRVASVVDFIYIYIYDFKCV